MAEVSGPFFAPGAGTVVNAYIHAAQDAIAHRTEARVHMLQHVYFKRPTGYYERHIINRDMGFQHLIHDSDVIYGYWLEGIGSRNYPATRFKGYSIMRKVTRSMQDRAVPIAMPYMNRLCEVLNR